MCSVFEWRSVFECCAIFAGSLGYFIYKEKKLYLKRPRLKPFENQTFGNQTFTIQKPIFKTFGFRMSFGFRSSVFGPYCMPHLFYVTKMLALIFSPQFYQFAVGIQNLTIQNPESFEIRTF